MLCSAILRTLAEVETGLLWIEPHGIGVIGNQVGLTAQTRNPEAVIGVRGEKRDKGWARIGRVADRHMEFVCGYNLQARIAVLPPELMADCNLLMRVARLGDCLDSDELSGRG